VPFKYLRYPVLGIYGDLNETKHFREGKLIVSLFGSAVVLMRHREEVLS
jgi:hypothetical protein